MTFFENIVNAFKGINILWSILDILFITFALYLVFIFLKKNNSKRLIKYVILLLFVVILLNAETFAGMKMTHVLVAYGFIAVLLIIAVLFQPELKRGLYKIASPKDAAELYSTTYDVSDEILIKTIDDIVKAAQNMSKKNVGALMVIVPGAPPMSILESGTKLNSELSSQLIECLFNTKAPLHDGAVFIRGNKILAAGCFLPLTQNQDIDKELGTRHRAAIGVTETNNCVAIIVSEESGVISVAVDGIIKRYFDSDMLKSTLMEVYGLRATDTTKKGGKAK